MENNWTIKQTKDLFALVLEASKQGKGLYTAFEQMAKISGGSVNSVRNYYYSQLKMFELVPKLAEDLGIEIIKSQRDDFELFTAEEIRALVEGILIGKAQGESVRAIIAKMSDGNLKKALRLQNKYRSMISHHRDYIIGVMNDLAAQNIVYFNPYSKQVVDGTASDNLQKLNEYISKLDASEVGSFLNIIKKLI